MPQAYIYLDPFLLCQILVLLQEDILRAGCSERCHDELFASQRPGWYIAEVVLVEESTGDSVEAMSLGDVLEVAGS